MVFYTYQGNFFKCFVAMSDIDSDLPPDLVYSSEESEDDDICVIIPEQLTRGKQWADKFEDLVRIRTLSPFLFNFTFGKEVWNNYLRKSGLLEPHWLSSSHETSLTLVNAVEMMELVIGCVLETLVSRRKREMVRSLLESVQKKEDMKDLIPAIFDNVLILQIRVKLPRECGEDKDKLTVAILYVCHQYNMMLTELDMKKDPVRNFENRNAEMNREIEHVKAQGNSAFKVENYKRAVELYTSGVEISAFNHILFANRAQAHLKLGEYLEAVVDAKRSMVISKTYEKAHQRYAMAWQQLGKLDRALKALKKAQDLGCDNKMIEPWIKKINTIKNEKNGDGQKVSISTQTNVKGKMVNGVGYTNGTDSTDDCCELVSDDETDWAPGFRRNREEAVQHPPKKLVRKNKVKQAVKAAKSDIRDPSPAPAAKAGAGSKSQNGAVRNSEIKDTKTRAPTTKPDSRPAATPQATTTKKSGAKPGSSATKRSPLDDLMSILNKGSEFIQQGNWSNAIINYQKATEKVKNFDALSFRDFPEIQQVLIKFTLGHTYIEAGTKKDIQEGIKTFYDILENHKTIKFPLIHLAIAKALWIQTRFSDSLGHIQLGLKEYRQQTDLMWPGTNQAIPESNKQKLKEELLSWKQSCEMPPTPDAVCRHARCDNHLRIHIYIQDPEFKGFVRVICYASCIIEYHPDCWKKIISDEVNKTSDKELLNTKCFTPDCKSLIKIIELYDNDGEEKRKVAAGHKPQMDDELKNKLPRTKMKPSSAATIQRRLERKARRKQLREESRAQQEDTEDDMMEAIDTLQEKANADQQKTQFIDAENTTAPDDIVKYATVLKKEGPDSNLYAGQSRASKPKKKKEKEKPRVLTLGQKSFAEIKGLEYEEENDWNSLEADLLTGPTPAEANMGIDDFELESRMAYYPVLNPDNPFAVPEELRPKLDLFEQSLANLSSPSPVQMMDKTGQNPFTNNGNLENIDNVSLASSSLSSERSIFDPPSRPKPKEAVPQAAEDDADVSIRDFLYSYFAEILKESGPLPVNDISIVQDLERLPLEATAVINSYGNVGEFLVSNIQFTMVEDIVCLIQDEPRARQMAQENNKSLVEKYRLELAKTMTNGPVKSKKRRGKKAKRESFDIADVPRKVDLKDQDQVSDKSWPESETSSGSKHSLFGPLMDTTNLQTSVTSSSDTGISVKNTKRDVVPGSSSATSMQDESEVRKSPLSADSIFDRPTRSPYDSPVLTPGESMKNKGAVSISSSVSASSHPPEGASDLASNQDRANAMDDISDDDDDVAGRHSDPPGKLAENDFTDRALTGQVQSPFLPGASQQQNNHQLLDTPLDILTGSGGNAKKRKTNKKKGGSSKISSTKRNIDLDSKMMEIKSKIESIPKTGTKQDDNELKDPVISVDSDVNSEPPTDWESLASSPSPKKVISRSDHVLSEKVSESPSAPAPPVKNVSQNVPCTQAPESISVHKTITSPESIPVHEPITSRFSHSSTPSPKLSTTSPQPAAQPQASLGSVSRVQSSYWPSCPPPPVQQQYQGQPIYFFPPPPPGSTPNYPQPQNTMSPPNRPAFSPVAMPTFPPLTSANLLKNVNPISVKDRIDQAVNTDPCAMDWNEVEALLGQLHDEKRELMDKLDAERRARFDLNREQAEQMELLVTQLKHQEGVVGETTKSLAQQEIQGSLYVNQISELEKRIKALESLHKCTEDERGKKDKEVKELRESLESERRASSKEKAMHENELKTMSHKCGTDMLRAEMAEIEVLKVKLTVSMHNIEQSLTKAEHYQNFYRDHINRIQSENVGVPQELVDVYSNWSKIVADIRFKQDKCKTEFEEQIRLIKRGGAQLSSLPVLQIAEAPPLPTRAKNETPEPKPAPANLTRKAPGFNAAPGARPPGFIIGGSNGRPRQVTTPASSNQSSFTRIIDSLSSMFPDYRQTDIKKFIMKLRESRGNTLSGLHLHNIISSVAEMILADNQSRRGEVAYPVPPSAPWALSNDRTLTEEIFQEEKDSCVICFNELMAERPQTLDCGHRYHERCIRRWMQEQSTCPTCRKYILLKEDFPALS